MYVELTNSDLVTFKWKLCPTHVALGLKLYLPKNAKTNKLKEAFPNYNPVNNYNNFSVLQSFALPRFGLVTWVLSVRAFAIPAITHLPAMYDHTELWKLDKMWKCAKIPKLSMTYPIREVAANNYLRNILPAVAYNFTSWNI